MMIIPRYMERYGYTHALRLLLSVEKYSPYQVSIAIVEIKSCIPEEDEDRNKGEEESRKNVSIGHCTRKSKKIDFEKHYEGKHMFYSKVPPYNGTFVPTQMRCKQTPIVAPKI